MQPHAVRIVRVSPVGELEISIHAQEHAVVGARLCDIGVRIVEQHARLAQSILLRGTGHLVWAISDLNRLGSLDVSVPSWQRYNSREPRALGFWDLSVSL